MTNEASVAALEHRLEVFVSSTIAECAAERAVVKEAVSSLNFDVVLFEDVGARPYPPRALYESRLRESEIFIAIYREQYGWTAPGMDVSGIEDEFNLASELGIPRLVYVFKTPTVRAERLSALVERAKQHAELTVWHYSHPEELRDRVREDVTALVSRSFRLAVHPDWGAADDHAVLERLVPAAQRFHRRQAESELLTAIRNHRIVQVVGEMGIGKTLLLALLAADQNWILISGRGRTPTELAQRLVQAFAAECGETATPSLTYRGAVVRAAALWKRLPGRVVAIDDCPSEAFVADVIGDEGDVGEVSFVFVLRPEADTAFHRFRVPTLVREEVADSWTARFGVAPSEHQIRQLATLSQGLPLYLRYIRSPDEVEVADPTLSMLELRRWRELSSLAQDLALYVALSDVPLSFEDYLSLAQMREADKAALVSAAAEAGALLVETASGFLVAHEHARDTLRAHLAGFPTRHGYYAGRLAGRLQEIGEYAATFMVLDRAGSPDAVTWSSRAAAEASREGDLRTLRWVLEKRVKYAEVQADRAALATTFMALAQAEDMAGDSEAAVGHWGQAEQVAKDAAAHLIPQIRLEQLTRRALKATTSAQIAELKALRDEQITQDDTWMAARVALDLSLIELRAGHKAEAAEDARMARQGFLDSGDEHGAHLATRNLAAALIALGSPEGDTLVAEISREEGAAGPSRSRAWLCNVTCRSLRRRGDPKSAQTFAEEAIQIGIRLGDPFVVATNSINLGNCLRDQDIFAEALAAYESAGREAQRMQSRSIDASAAWHAADVLNRQGNFARALQYADYGIALTTETSFDEDLSRAYEEKAFALNGLRRTSEAATHYLKAAVAISIASDRSRRGWLLSRAAWLWHDLSDRDQYLREFGSAYGCIAEGPAAMALALLPKLADEVAADHFLRVFGVHFRFIFNEVPESVARRFFRLSIERLLGQAQSDHASTKRVLPLIPLLSALPGKALTLTLMTEFGDQVQDTLENLSFRPRNDLAALYVVKLKLGRQVIMSFEQIDDRPETAAVTALLTMFFYGFQERIDAEILGGSPAVRSELHLGIIAQSEALELVPQMTLSDTEQFAVTRPTRFDDSVPTYVVYRDDLLERSATTDAGRNDLLGLIARVLVEVTFQLLRKEVDVATLQPSIRSIVTKLA